LQVYISRKRGHVTSGPLRNGATGKLSVFKSCGWPILYKKQSNNVKLRAAQD